MSSRNESSIENRLQMLHVHVLLVAPLCACHMAQSGADRHESLVAVVETAHHTGTAADLPVQPLNAVVGPDASPMFGRKVCVGQRLFHAILKLLCSLFQFQRTEFCHHRFCLFTGGFFALLGVDRLEHFCHQLYLGLGHNRRHCGKSAPRSAGTWLREILRLLSTACTDRCPQR